MAAADLTSSLLDTDARIIAENATHAVVAIRIPKATLRRNFHFFAAMADLAPSIAPEREIEDH